MKTIQYILLVCCLCLFWESEAQNRSIEFREGNWEQMLKMAKKEKKMIFVDCYTSWCGPCKMLAKNIFTQDHVADFYNTNFICFQIDMEKGEGPQLARKYGVAAFPTLLYIDKDATLKHCVVGYQQADELIQNGEKALKGEQTLLDFQKRYDSGDRDRAFVKQYIDVLFKAYRPQLQKEVVTEYINELSDAEFYTRETWDIIIRNLSDPLSPILKKVAANRYRFSHIVSRDTIDIFIDYTLKSAVSSFVWWTPEKGAFNQQRYDELLAYLFTQPLPKVPQYVASLYAADYLKTGDIRGMLDEMYRSLKYGIFYIPQDKLDFIRNFLRHVETCDNDIFINEVNIWLDKLIESASSGYYKSEYMKVKARILRVLGKTDEANELEQRAPAVRKL